MAKNELELDILSDITSDSYTSRCARCEQANIRDVFELCPSCGLDLGPSSKYAIPENPDIKENFMAPPQPSTYSFVVFEITCSHRLGCQLYGDGPTAVEKLLDDISTIRHGKLLYAQGEQMQPLIARGLLPSVGDILVSVDGVGISHLNAAQVRNANSIMVVTKYCDI